MLTIKPPDETFVKLKTIWGEYKNDSGICPKDGATLEFSMTAAVRNYTQFL